MEFPKQRFYYGWVITALAALMYGVKSGILLYGSGPLVDALLKQYKWSNTEIGIAFSLKSWFGLLTPLVGIALIKWGPRKVLWISGLVTVIATALTAYISTPLQFMLTYGVGLAIGMVFTSFLSIFAIVNNWWEARRGLHTGIVNGAAGIGSAVFVPLIAWMLATYGWKQAIIYSAVILLVLGVIPQWILFRDRPEEKGQKMDGGVIALNEYTKTKSYYFSPVDWDVKDALRTYQLYFILLAWCGMTWGFISVIIFAFTHLTNIGLSLAQVSSIQGAMGVFTVIGSLVTGYLVDRFGPRPMLVITSLTNALGIILLIVTKSAAIAWAYSVVLGFGIGMTVPCVIPMIASYYGNKNFGAIQGSVMWILSATSGICPLVMGMIADKIGYTSGFAIGAVVCIIGGVLAWVSKPPTVPARYSERKQEVQQEVQMQP